MNEQTLKKILQKNGIKCLQSIEKIDIGFSNDVYSIDDKYILKICGSGNKEDEIMMEKDIYLLQLFKDKLPVPKIIKIDTSKKLIDRIYFIYHKIQGENLYEKWHEYSDKQRKNIIEQICSMVQIINKTPYKKLLHKFDFDSKENWHDNVCSAIEESLRKIKKQKLLSKSVIDKVQKYVNENHEILRESKMGLTYWDVHFDNFIVSKGKIVAMLDFERTYITSIDYTVDVIKRMVEFPTKYASQKAEKYIKASDYKHLLKWYQEYYPELFNFKDLNTRLNLYSIKGSLYDIFYYPKAKEPREMLIKAIS